MLIFLKDILKRKHTLIKIFGDLPMQVISGSAHFQTQVFPRDELVLGGLHFYASELPMQSINRSCIDVLSA